MDGEWELNVRCHLQRNGHIFNAAYQCGGLKDVIVKGVGIRTVTLFTRVVRHICLGDLPHWLIANHSIISSTATICDNNGESGHGPVWKHWKPALHPYKALSCYDLLGIFFLITLEWGCSIYVIQIQCTGSLGQAINSVITSKFDMRQSPLIGCVDWGILGNGELTFYFLNNTESTKSANLELQTITSFTFLEQ